MKESEPPPMEFFNALANLSDTKDNYLFQAINIRKNKTQYHIDDIATTPNLTSKISNLFVFRKVLLRKQNLLGLILMEKRFWTALANGVLHLKLLMGLL